MPRPRPILTASTAPLEVLDDGDALHYVRATELLRIARARRDARLAAEAMTGAKVSEQTPPTNETTPALPTAQGLNSIFN